MIDLGYQFQHFKYGIIFYYLRLNVIYFDEIHFILTFNSIISTKTPYKHNLNSLFYMPTIFLETEYQINKTK